MAETRVGKFAVDLWDGFDMICRHTNNEIQFVKDVLKFFKKRKELEEEYAKNLAKLAQKSQYTIPLGTVCRGWEDLLTQTQNTAHIHTSVVNQLNEKVIESLTVLIKDLETTRKGLYTEGTSLNNEYQKQVDDLKKSKANYEKASKEAEIAQKTLDAAKVDGITKAKDLPKFEREATKKQQTAQSLDETYKKKVEETNNFLESYYTEKMPKILSEFERLETVRVHMLKGNMKKYLSILESVPPTLGREIRTLADSVDLISTEADIDMFVKQNKTGAEIPEPFEYEPYVGGNVQAKSTAPLTHRFMKFVPNKTASSENVAAPAALGPVPVAKKDPPPTASFGVTLNKVMERHKGTAPNGVEVPKVLLVLTEAVLKMGGLKTEGIFRVPATANEVKSIKEKIDEGNFASIDTSGNVHTPCALLKLWLRELADPIIPISVYEIATENPEKSLDLFEGLPEINKKVTTFIFNFLQALANPEYVEITKMSKDNLCMVFAPGFLRCPYTEPNRILSAAEKEKAFLMNLWDKIPPNNKNWAHLLPNSDSLPPPYTEVATSSLADAQSDSPPPGYDILSSAVDNEQKGATQSPTSARFNIGGNRQKRTSEKLLGPLQFDS